MARPSEEEFVKQGFSEAELQALDAPQAEAPAPEPEAAPEPVRTDNRARDESGRFVKAEEQAPKPVDEPKSVDLRALQEARNENRDLREKYGRLEERTNIMLQRLEEQSKPKEPAKPTKPNPDENIFEYARWLETELEGLGKKVNGWEQQATEASEANAKETTIWGFWDNSARAYSAEKSDFGDAAKWLSDYRFKQLEAYSAVNPGYKDPRNIHAQIDAELRQIVVESAENKRNPAEVVYQLASGLGYQPGQAQAAPQAQPQAPKGPEAIREMAQRQDRHMSLSSIQGGEPPKALDAKALATMSDADFKKLMSTAEGRAEAAAIMGVQ